MDQIIIEHYKNSCNFLSFEEFKIQFIVHNGLIFNKEQVYKNEFEEKILINGKKEEYCIDYKNKEVKGNYKNGKREGFWIFWYENGNKK